MTLTLQHDPAKQDYAALHECYSVPWGCATLSRKSLPLDHTPWLAHVAGWSDTSKPILRDPISGVRPYLQSPPGCVVAYGACRQDGQSVVPIHFGLVSPIRSSLLAAEKTCHLGADMDRELARWWSWLGPSFWRAWRRSGFDILTDWLDSGCAGWPAVPGPANHTPKGRFVAGSWSGERPGACLDLWFRPEPIPQPRPAFPPIPPGRSPAYDRFRAVHFPSSTSTGHTPTPSIFPPSPASSRRRQILKDRYSFAAGRRAHAETERLVRDLFASEESHTQRPFTAVTPPEPDLFTNDD